MWTKKHDKKSPPWVPLWGSSGHHPMKRSVHGTVPMSRVATEKKPSQKPFKKGENEGVLICACISDRSIYHMKFMICCFNETKLK